MEAETIGELIVRVRAELGLSQLGLAARLCACAGSATVTRHEISRWERGERIPTAYWLAWLALALDRPVAELVHAAVAGRERRAAQPPRRWIQHAPGVYRRRAA
jgi:transcriptional regulator with XRE-family HTH domain